METAAAENAKEPRKRTSSRNGKSKKGFLPGLAPPNSKLLDRMGEAYYVRLRAWQAEQTALQGMREEMIQRMKVEKIKFYQTPDGVKLERNGTEKLKVSKAKDKEP